MPILYKRFGWKTADDDCATSSQPCTRDRVSTVSRVVTRRAVTIHIRECLSPSVPTVDAPRGCFKTVTRGAHRAV